MSAQPDHEGFLRELERGRSYEKAVALRLLDEGFAVRIGTLEKAATPWEGARFHDETDVIVNDRIPLEVKSRSFSFTTPADFPYSTAYICAVRRWQARQVKPYAFVFVSQSTGAMLALGGSTFTEWEVATPADHRRYGWVTPTYCVSRELLVPLDALVTALHRVEP